MQSIDQKEHDMTKQAVQKTATEQPSDFELKVQKLREIYADA